MLNLVNSAWVGAKVLKQWVVVQCFHCTIRYSTVYADGNQDRERERYPA